MAVGMQRHPMAVAQNGELRAKTARDAQTSMFKSPTTVQRAVGMKQLQAWYVQDPLKRANRKEEGGVERVQARSKTRGAQENWSRRVAVECASERCCWYKTAFSRNGSQRIC